MENESSAVENSVHVVIHEDTPSVADVAVVHAEPLREVEPTSLYEKDQPFDPEPNQQPNKKRPDYGNSRYVCPKVCEDWCRCCADICRCFDSTLSCCYCWLDCCCFLNPAIHNHDHLSGMSDPICCWCFQLNIDGNIKCSEDCQVCSDLTNACCNICSLSSCQGFAEGCCRCLTDVSACGEGLRLVLDCLRGVGECFCEVFECCK